MEQAQMNRAPSSPEEMTTSTEERMRNMRATMEQYMTSASDRARVAAAYADRTVHQNPWTAVSVGFGLGMMFGALVTLLASRPSRSMLDQFR
jgi:ElaB/YqjD/DUF883 family membrane-anchored ribosome-binding protein